VVLLVRLDEIFKRDLILECVDLGVDLAKNLIAQPLGFPLRELVAVSKVVPNLLSFDLVHRFDHPDSIPDVPVWSRAFLPNHARHLVFTSSHPFSLRWLEQDRLVGQLSTQERLAAEGANGAVICGA
jgi:hypothetical protein